MPENGGSMEAEDGAGDGSDDESGMRESGAGGGGGGGGGGDGLSGPDLRRRSRIAGGMKGWRLRGVEWRVKLGILPAGNASIDAMRRAAADGRRKYAELRRRLLVDPHTADDVKQTPRLMMDNPLSLDPESVWGKYFRNAELEKTIEKNLTRLYPEYCVFFQSASCQDMMRRILLVWSLIHPQSSYRPGMHELLAPLLYVLHVDVVRLSQVKDRFEDLFDDRFDSLSLQEQHVKDKVESAKNFCGEMVVARDSINFEGGVNASKEVIIDHEDQRVDLSEIVQGSDMYGVEGELGALLSARFLEHDVYCMLDALLSGQDGAVAMADYFTSSANGGRPPVIEASDSVYRTLAAADLSLYTHLVELRVEPQLFALRWLRLLFGREFILEDLVQIWDTIFGADNTPLSKGGVDDSGEMKVSQRSALISAFSVSMLLYVRPALLASPDVTTCLHRLLNFPQVRDVRDLIESAKSLQLVAVMAVKSPSTPLPRIARTSEGRNAGKHARNGSFSPPAPQLHVVRPQSLSCSSPEVVRPSMSLPGSYWEEKWTHSILQKRNLDESLSAGVPRADSIQIASDNGEREMLTSGRHSRTSSGGKQQALDCTRACSLYADSADDGGQEMLRRGMAESVSDPRAKPSSLASIVSNNDQSFRISEADEQERREISEMDVVSATASASAVQRFHSDDTGTVQDLFSVRVTIGSRTGSVEGRDNDAEIEDAIGLERGRDCTTPVERDSTLEDCTSCPPRPGTPEEFSGPSSCEATGRTFKLQDSLSPRDTESHEIEGEAAASAVEMKKTSNKLLLALEQKNGGKAVLVSEPAAKHPEMVDLPSMGSCASLKVVQESRPQNLRTDDSIPTGTSREISGTEIAGNEIEEESVPSSSMEPLVPSKSKPPLPPARFGRFTWMWSIGRTSSTEKPITIQGPKEDITGEEVPICGSASNSELSATTAGNTAQRKKKSWWRANSDVVPEDFMETGNTDSTCEAEGTGDGQETLVPTKPSTEPASVAPEEGTVVGLPDISGACQDGAEKPKDMTPSAALQSLGLSVLEHVQVLETALSQKVSVLGIENMMWTPAIRDKNENANKTGLGNMGQAAALTAIAELRKISQALQQM